MAVRVTAGRITIVAVLAVALAGVQFAPALFTSIDIPALRGQSTTAECSDGIDNDGDGKIDYEAPTSVIISAGVRIENVNRLSRPPDFVLNPGQSVVSFSPSSETFVYDDFGNTADCSQMTHEVIGQSVYAFVNDTPTDDNSGSCEVRLELTNGSSDPDCSSETDDSEGTTSSSGSDSSTPTGTTGGSGGPGGTGGGSASSASSAPTYYCYSCEDGCAGAEQQSTACDEDGGWYGYDVDDEGSLCASRCTSSSPSSASATASTSSSAPTYYCYSCEDGCAGAEQQSTACDEDGGWYGYDVDDEGSLCASRCTSSSPSSASAAASTPTSSYASSYESSDESSSSSSSSSVGYCGDENVDSDGPNDVDEPEDDPDSDDEECDDGDQNGVGSKYNCTAECTVPKCGDNIKQAWLGEECDKGALNRDGPYTEIDGSPNYLLEWCSLECKKPECSNGRDQLNIGEGGTENIADNLVDAEDGGCYEKICNFNSLYLPGKDNENNPCLVKKPGTVNPPSPGEQKPLGSSCTDSTECSGYESGSNGQIFCISNTGPDYGVCTDVGADSGLAQARGEILLAQAGGGGVNFPICIPGVCGHMVGNEAACGGAFQFEGDTCDNQRLRKQCLYNTAVAMGQCPGGEIVPVPLGQDASCLDGQAPNQQKMCGPAGQWFCKCPGDNVQLWQENLVQCGSKCGDGNVDPGEDCDDGNQVNNDQCTNLCKQNVGGQCTGKECQDPAAIAACAAQNGAVCQADAQLPCIKCAPPVGGQCTGNECTNGGDAAAAAQGMECSLIPNFPCITFIPPNSCGNGEIDIVPPQVVDEGCEVVGTSGQYCVAEGMVIDDFGVFQPSHQCFQAANCVENAAGQCEWEMTPDVEQCLEESAINGGGLPPGCVCNGDRLLPGCPVKFVRNPCVPLGGPQAFDPPVLTAQIVDPPDGGVAVACPRDVRRCCQNGQIIVMGRDPANRCQFTNCNTDLTACLTPENRCVRGGCQGELCVPLGDTTNTTCNNDPSNACYGTAECAWTGTACAWTQTPELRECLSDNADGTCPTDQSCLSRGACADQGGTPGNACGAADTNVCCGGIGPDNPVEECDDGNRVDGDACGNDCKINCTKNADCPEGACVNGQCVDQCVAPAGPVAMHGSAGLSDRGYQFLPRLMARGDFSLLP